MAPDEASEFGRATVEAVSVPGKAIFITEELLMALEPQRRYSDDR
jgi:hypothetical protein